MRYSKLYKSCSVLILLSILFSSLQVQYVFAEFLSIPELSPALSSPPEPAAKAPTETTNKPPSAPAGDKNTTPAAKPSAKPLAASPVPTISLSAPSSVQLGGTFNFTVTFANNTTDFGYGPFVDILIPHRGNDGDIFSPPITGTVDGITVTAVSVNGQSIGITSNPSIPITGTTFDANSGGQLVNIVNKNSIPLSFATDAILQDFTGSYLTHPFAHSSISNAYLTITGTAGDQLLTVRLPFGSFAPGQPAVTVNFTAQLSQYADITQTLNLKARGGFMYGADALDNWCCDYIYPTLTQPSNDATTWTPTAPVTPYLLTTSKSNNLPEGETATGPNFSRSYNLNVTVASGQTITNVVITDVLPSSTAWLSTTILGGTGSCNSPSPITGATVICTFPTVVGGTSDPSVRIGFYVPLKDFGGTNIITPSTGDDVAASNTFTATANWTPLDPRDPVGSVGGVCTNCPSTHTDKSVAIQKGAGSTTVRPGSIVTYTLNFQVSDYFAFTNLVITDTLSDGQHYYEDATHLPAMSINGNTATYALGSGTVTNTITNTSYLIWQNFSDPPVAPISATAKVVSGTLQSPYRDDSAADDGTTQIVFNVSNEMERRLGLGDSKNRQMIGGCVPVAGFNPGAQTDCAYNDGPTTGVITYYVQVQDYFNNNFPSGDASVDHGDTLTNTVTIYGELLDVGDNATVTGNNEVDGSSASLSVQFGTLSKTLYAINGVITTTTGTTSTVALVSPGDVLTFRIKYTQPASDFETTNFVDYLPLPVLKVNGLITFTNESCTSLTSTNVYTTTGVPLVGNACLGVSDTYHSISTTGEPTPAVIPTMVTSTVTNTVTFTYAKYDSVSNTSTTFDLLYSIVVANDPFADKMYLTNQAQSTEGTTNAGNSVLNTTSQIQLGQPLMKTTKSAVASNHSPTNTVTLSPTLPVTFIDSGQSGKPWAGSTIITTNTSISSSISGVDAGDLVTFAIKLYNTGSSPKGAFDLAITDTIPDGFQIPPTSTYASGLNLKIYQGDGMEFTQFTDINDVITTDGSILFGSGLKLVDTTVGACQAETVGAGKNVIIITYDLMPKTAITAGATFTNTASIIRYAGEEGGTNHVVNPITADATATIKSPQIASKTVVSTDQAHTTITNVVIGELITYTAVLNIPEGTLPGTKFTDTLASSLTTGLAFISVDAISASSAITTDIVGGFDAVRTNATFITPTNSQAGSQLYLDFGKLVNTDTVDTVTETITITYTAVALNVTGNITGTRLTNTAQLATVVTSTTTGTISVLTSYTSSGVKIVEPSFTSTKAASPSAGDAGDTITYTVTITNPSTSITGFNITFTDTIPTDLTYSTGSLTAVSGITPTSLNASGNVITATWDVFTSSQNSVLQFAATISNTIATNQTITNSGQTRWTSIPGSPGTLSTLNSNSVERTGSVTDTGGAANTYIITATAAITTTSTEPTKSITTTSEAHTPESGSPRPVAIGEIVRYRLVTHIAEGTSNTFTLRDNMPRGLQIITDSVRVSFVCDNGGSCMTSSAAPGININTISTTAPSSTMPAGTITVTGNPSTGSYTVDFGFGTLVNSDNDSDKEYIVMEFNALVMNISNNSIGTTRNNNYQAIINGVTQSASSNVGVRIREPQIASIVKAVSAPSPLDASDTITYTLTFTVITGTNNTAAFDVMVTDTIQSNLYNVNVVTGTTSGGTSLCSSSVFTATLSLPTAGGTFSCVNPGATGIITITAQVTDTVSAGQPISNTASLSFTSLPGPQGTTTNGTGSSVTDTAGSTFGERVVITPTQNIVTNTISTPIITKTTPSPITYAVGSSITYDLVVTLPEGLTNNFQITDTLPTNLGYVSHALVTGAGGSLSSAYNGTVTTPTCNGGASCAADSNGTLLFTFATPITTTGDNDSTNNAFILRITAVVLNIASNQQGTLVTNTARLTYTHPITGTATISSTNSPVITVTEPSINFTKTVSFVSPVDAGDVVTYTLTYTNGSGASVSTAHDVQITDTLPISITLNLGSIVSSTTGTVGTITNTSAGNNITFTVDSVAPGASLIVTYTATVQDTVIQGDIISNTSRSNWTSTSGTNTKERDGSGGINDYVLTSTKSFTVTATSPIITKTTPTPTTYTIGDIVTYTIPVTLPEGTTRSLLLTDTMQSGLVFVTGTVTAGNFNGTLNTSPTITSTTTTATFDFGNTIATGDNNTSNDTFTVTVSARVENIIGNQAGTTLTNTARLGYSHPVTGTVLVTSTITPTITVVEPSITLNKNVTFVSPLGAGSTITYTLTYSNGSGANVSTANDVQITDTLPSGVTLNLGSIVSSTTGTVGTITNNSAGSNVLFTVASVAPNATVLITYTATLANSVSQSDVLSNAAQTSWTSLTGTNANERTGSGGVNDYISSTVRSVTVTVSNPTITKTTPSPITYTIGELITYTIPVTLFEGTTRALFVTDTMQSGLAYVTHTIDTTNFNGTVTAAPTTTTSGNDVTFNFGDTVTAGDNVNSNNTFTVTVTLRVSNVAGNQAGTTLTNTARLTYTNPVTGTVTVNSSNTPTITVTEPSMTLSKSVTVNSPVDAGDVVTYTLGFVNGSGANVSTAYDVVITDVVPTQLTLGAINTTTTGTVTSVSNLSAGNIVTFTISSIAPNSGISIVYTATVNGTITPNEIVNNTSDARWASTSDSTNSGATNGRRDHTGGVNDYQTTSAAATFTSTNPTVSKSILATSASHTSGSNLTIGEVVTYAIKITLPEGTVMTDTVLDDLPTGMSFVAGSTQIIVTTGASGGLLTQDFGGTVPAPTVTSAGGSGDNVTFDFATPITITADNNVNNNAFLITFRAVVLNVGTNLGTPATNLPNVVTMTINSGISSTTPVNITVVEPAPAINKSFFPTTGTTNDVITVTLVVSNTAGTSAMYDIVITDTLPTSKFNTILAATTPAGYTFATTASGGLNYITYTSNSGISLAAGSTVTFQFKGTLASTVVDGETIPNVANITQASTLDGTDTNERSYTATASANFTVQSTDLRITKSHTGNMAPATDSTFTIVVDNVSSFAANGTLTMTDTVPANLVVQTVAAGLGWNCGGSAGQNVNCTFAGPVFGGAVLPSIVVTVRPTAVGIYTNTAFISIVGSDSNTANNVFTDTVSVVSNQPDLSITKTATSAFTVGSSGTFALTVQNVSPNTATSSTTTITDTLPSELDYVSAIGTNWTCNYTLGTRQIVCTHPDPIFASAFAPNIVVTVSPNTTGTFTNTVTVKNSGDTNSTNDNASRSVTVSAGPVPDLTIAKSHVGTVTVGTNKDFTLVVTNIGSATTVSGTTTVTDTLPAELNYVNASGTGWSCSFDSSTRIITCTTTTQIAVGGSSSILLTTTPLTATASITNTARVTTPGETTTSNNTAQDNFAVTASAQPDLSVSKTLSGSFAHGSTGTYTLTVTNNGTAATTSTITITDTLPAQLTFASASGTGWTCNNVPPVVCTHAGPATANGGALPSIILTVNVNMPGGGTVTNTVTVKTPGDTNTSNDTTDRPTTINASSSPDITVSKTHVGSFVVGQTGTFTLTVSNNGSSAVTATSIITVTDALPAQLTFASASGTGWTCSSITPTCAISSTLAAGGSYPPITLIVTATTAGGPFTNSAAITTTGADVTSTNNTATDSVSVSAAAGPDLSVAKTHATNFVLNQLGSYTVTVTNIGNGPTTSTIAVTDTLPVGLTFANGGGTNWTCGAVGQNVTCNYVGAAVAAGAAMPSITLNVTATVAPNTFVNSAYVSSVGDVNSANDRGDDTTIVDVTAQPDLSVTKTHSGVFPIGSTGVFTIRVRNQGAGLFTAISPTHVIITDTLQTGLTFASATGTDWTCSLIGGVTVQCVYLSTATTTTITSGVTLPDITLSVSVGIAALGVFNNVVTVTPNDNNLLNNTATDQVVVPQTVNLSIAKTVNNATPSTGQNVTFNITLSNSGPFSATNVVVNDALPSGLTYVSAVPSQGTYNQNTGQWALGATPIPPTGTATLQIVATFTANSAVVNTAQIASLTQTNNSSAILSASALVSPAGSGGGGGGGAGSGGTGAGPIVFDPAITKAPTLIQAQIGDPVEFIITVTNPNAIAVAGVVASDPLPAEVDFISASTSHGTTSFNAATRRVDINLGVMAGGQVSTIKIQTVVNNKAQPPNAFRNRAYVSSTVSNDSEVQAVPKAIPATGDGRGEAEWLLALALWLLIASLPLAAWKLRQRIKRKA